MLPEQRRRRILEYIVKWGAADVPALSVQFDASHATIRRDLQALHEQQLVMRTHGGAVVNDGDVHAEPLHHEKARTRTAEKDAIARLAEEDVRDGDVIILDSGSTTFALAKRLKNKRDLTVITTDLKIAVELTDAIGVEVVIIGGNVRPQLFSLVGPVAEEALADMHADAAFLGADAIDLEVGVTNTNLAEVAVKRCVLASSSRAVLMADHTKFEKRSLARVTPLDAFQRVLSDDGLSQRVINSYQRAHVEIEIAETR